MNYLIILLHQRNKVDHGLIVSEDTDDGEVLNHYQSGIIYSNTLDTLLGTKSNTGIPLSKEEKIISFLNTLNDEEFVKNKEIQVF